MFVYKITNTINNRIYVGLTTNSIEKRWREHKCAANTGSEKPLYRAMRKHGIDNFSIHVIYQATSIEDMRAAELRFIKELKAHALENGYNLTDHGFVHGRLNQPNGELVFNSKLTEEIVAFIRDPIHWDKSNSMLLKMVKEKFQIEVSRDGVRDARRGDTWKHLNDKHPPVKVRQGSRAAPMTEERRKIALETLEKYRSAAQLKSAELRRRKRGLNAKLSEQQVKDIFYNTLSFKKTAKMFNIDPKMVSLIKKREAHVYLTKDL